jgi:hypothetical protein
MNIIDRARERIERDGWVQGSFGDDGHPVCLFRALKLEGHTPDERLGAYAAVDAELPMFALGRITKFNDDPSTSLEDVLLVLKRASARLDGAAS